MLEFNRSVLAANILERPGPVELGTAPGALGPARQHRPGEVPEQVLDILCHDRIVPESCGKGFWGSPIQVTAPYGRGSVTICKHEHS